VWKERRKKSLLRLKEEQRTGKNGFVSNIIVNLNGELNSNFSPKQQILNESNLFYRFISLNEKKGTRKNNGNLYLN